VQFPIEASAPLRRRRVHLASVVIEPSITEATGNPNVLCTAGKQDIMEFFMLY
jgi:hypothetical protein